MNFRLNYNCETANNLQINNEYFIGNLDHSVNAKNTQQRQNSEHESV